MIIRCSDFLNESQTKYQKGVFWKDNVEEVCNVEWEDLSITLKSFRGSGEYQIKFEDTEHKYVVYLDVKRGQETLLLDDGEISHEEISNKFWKKFEEEFLKNPAENLRNMKYVPKCLGDVQHHKESERFGF